MAISAVSGNSAAHPPTDLDRQVAVMKKTRDIEKASAEALLELIKPAPSAGHIGRIISTYA